MDNETKHYQLGTLLISIGTLWAWDDMHYMLRAWTCGAMALWVLMFYLIRPSVLRLVRRMEGERRSLVLKVVEAPELDPRTTAGKSMTRLIALGFATTGIESGNLDYEIAISRVQDLSDGDFRDLLWCIGQVRAGVIKAHEGLDPEHEVH